MSFNQVLQFELEFGVGRLTFVSKINYNYLFIIIKYCIENGVLELIHGLQ